LKLSVDDRQLVDAQTTVIGNGIVYRATVVGNVPFAVKAERAVMAGTFGNFSRL
jgi:hypothetical protein